MAADSRPLSPEAYLNQSAKLFGSAGWPKAPILRSAASAIPTDVVRLLSGWVIRVFRQKPAAISSQSGQPLQCDGFSQ